MRELLLDGFQSPHGILSMYIEVLCGFTPTDARRFIEEEPDIRHLKDSMKFTILFLDFSKILEGLFPQSSLRLV